MFEQLGSEGKTPTPEKLRISVSNLISRVRVNETGKTYHVAARSDRPFILPDGRSVLRFQAIGGAAKVSSMLRKELSKDFGATFAIGSSTEEDDDARFFIPSSVSDEDVARVLNTFSVEHSDAFETDVLREVGDELGEELHILSREDLAQLSAHFIAAVSPVHWQGTTSYREQAGTTSRRLFRIYELSLPELVFKKLRTSDKIRILSDTDLASIRAATAIGNPAALSSEGDAVFVENVALEGSVSPPHAS